MQDQIQTIGMMIVKGVIMPVVGLFVAWASAHLPAWIASKTRNQRVSGALSHLAELAFAVVQEVEQTVVAGLGNKATADELRGARDRAITTIKAHLGEQGLKELATALGLDADAVDKLIITYIESAVRNMGTSATLTTVEIPAAVPVPVVVKKTTTTTPDMSGGHTVVEKTTTTQGGYVMLPALIAMTIAAALAFLLVGCGAAQECKDPANMNNLKCTAVNSTIDCTKGELPAVVAQVGPVVSKLIGEATGADGTVDWAQVEHTIGTLGESYGTCILGNIIENYMVAPPKLSPGEVSPRIDVLKAGLAHAKTALWHLDPSTVIHTDKGDLQ